MPFIRITLGKAANDPQKHMIASRSTALIADILHKRAEVTAVQVINATPDGWFIAGAPVAATPTPTHCELYITAGTNSREEKSAMIAALHHLLTEACGEMPEASYIVIHEIPASDWGYAGQTQAARQRRAAPL